MLDSVRPEFKNKETAKCVTQGFVPKHRTTGWTPQGPRRLDACAPFYLMMERQKMKMAICDSDSDYSHAP